MNYAIYARKSTESEERQVQSIDDQLRLDRELADQHALAVHPRHVLSESKSAKEPFKRTEFQQLVALVEKGQVQGVIAYHPNRLSRNETDAATLIRLLRERKLRDLRFVSYTFDNSPEGIMFLQLALSQSQYESAKLAREVVRGLDSRIRKGWWPGKAPEGYLNDFETHTILPDPERLPLIERAFRVLLAGECNVLEAIRILNEEWGYRSKQRAHTGGRPLSRTAGYRLFANPFYAGYMELRGELVPGKHPAVITLEEFRRVQELAGRGGGYTKRDYPYAGLIRCAGCGWSVVGERQRGRHQKGDWTYYRCGNRNCTNGRQALREDRLEETLRSELRRLTWPEEVRQIVADELAAWLREEAGELWQLQQDQRRNCQELRRRQETLLEMRLSGEIDPETFRRKDAELRQKGALLHAESAENREQTREALATVDQAVEFVCRAEAAFTGGDSPTRRQLADALGAKYLLDGGQLVIEPNPLLSPFLRPVGARSARTVPSPEKLVPKLVALEGRLQPRKVRSYKAKGTRFSDRIPHGWAVGTGLQTFKLAIQGYRMADLAFLPKIEDFVFAAVQRIAKEPDRQRRR